MRKLLNTLYVTLPEAYIACEGANILVKHESEIKFRVPIHNLEDIVCFSYIGASPAAMKLCCDHGVGLAFLSEQGSFLARVSGKISGNILLRKKQYSLALSPQETLLLAKAFVIGKIANCRAVLHRAVRDHGDSINSEAIGNSMSTLSSSIRYSEKADNYQQLLGVEGMASSSYFEVFDHLILNHKKDFFFLRRTRRPPLDPINSLLSFTYSLLRNEIVSALETVGLDPQAGFLHKDRPGRPSLALDMMEELRPHLADRLVLSLVNRNQVSITGFSHQENGAVMMDEDTRKTVILAWQSRKKDIITHPFLEEKIPIGLIPYAQAMLLARHLRGDIEGYPPFIWR